MTATLNDTDFREFQSIIYQTAGIHLSHNKRAMLGGRLSKRLRALRVDCYADYLRRVRESSDEMEQMLDCVTTNETRFFREQKQFEFLESALIEKWKGQAEAGLRSRTVRVWSAGCSTGEEPYSVAMLLRAALGSRWDVSILATDLSLRVLSAARAGIWPIEKAAHIPEPLLKQFMLRGHGTQSGKMKASGEIRSLISFGRLNLNATDYGVGELFDLILCRNVLIYFDTDSRRSVVDRLVDHLLPGGWLFVGHAETLHGVTSRVRSVLPTIYQLDASTG